MADAITLKKTDGVGRAGAQADQRDVRADAERASNPASPSASATRERNLNGPDQALWCVHIEGLGDYIAASSRDAAGREAAAINAYIDGAGHDLPDGIVRAEAIEWPFTAAGHARSLETDWEDLQRMAHRRTAHAGARTPAHSRDNRESLLPALVRRIRALVSGG
jgi:hypothetical protein